MANQQLADVYLDRNRADDREKELDRFRKAGVLYELDELVDVSDEYGSPKALWRTSDGTIVREANPRGEQPVGAIVGVNKAGDERIWMRLANVDRNTLWKLEETQRKERERLEVREKNARKFLAKAKKVDKTPLTKLIPGFTDRQGTANLDAVERLIEENPDIEVAVVRKSAVTVSIRSEAELHQVVDKMGLSKNEANGFHGSIRHDSSQAKLLLRHLHDLGPLAVEFIASGKRPKADDNKKALANRLGPAGIWLA